MLMSAVAEAQIAARTALPSVQFFTDLPLGSAAQQHLATEKAGCTHQRATDQHGGEIQREGAPRGISADEKAPCSQADNQSESWPHKIVMPQNSTSPADYTFA